MDKKTEEVLNYIIEKQDGFWRVTVESVVDWLINQDFEINYKGCEYLSSDAIKY